MKSGQWTRRLPVIAGAVAIIGIGGLTAGCGGGKETPSTTTTTPTTTATSAPAPSPTEKGMTPGAPNSFAPQVKAPPPRTALPGNVITGGRN
jgi:hypothetical protein